MPQTTELPARPASNGVIDRTRPTACDLRRMGSRKKKPGRELVATEERQAPRTVRIEIGLLRILKAMVRAVTAPMFAASVRIFLIRSSGLNGDRPAGSS